MEIIFIRIIESLLLPPGLMIVMLVLGIVLLKRYSRLGRFLLLGGLALLWLASLPLLAQWNAQLFEGIPPLTEEALAQSPAQAIVILGGGRRVDAPEYAADIVGTATLERLRYGAYLHRLTQLPILVTGGAPYGHPTSEATLMQQALIEDFKIEARWLEGNSSNTWENAQFSQKMLAQENIQHIYLVTDALHITRSIKAFTTAGLKVTPAPTGFTQSAKDRPLILSLLPSSRAISIHRRLAHELVGRIWYAIRY